MRYELPKQQHAGGMALPRIFGFLEEQREALGVESYSLSQTSLEQIFNGFASQQEEEKGGAAGIVVQ